MRNLALSIATVLVLAVVSPAFAQPFADVPTDHWAFDAIAELAAKGVIEGYPDGTFKGDRGITRYEVAMIVARILARIEAIKIPGAPAPAPAPAAPPAAVTPAQVQTIQRLVNEFRAELAALGVRVTAVEEELAALKQVVTATRITGTSALYYYVETAAYASAEVDNLLTFTTATGPWTVVTRLNFGSGTDGDSDWGAGTPSIEMTTFDLAYFDWSAGPFGSKWRVGRQRYTLGFRGLLFNSTETASDSFDGFKTDWSFGPLALTVATFYDTGNLDDIWAISAGFNLLPGWTTRAHYYMQRPWEPSAASDNGWQLDLSGNLFGLALSAGYATFTPAVGASSTAYQAGVELDLGSMMGMGGTTLQVAYKDYGPGTAPSHSNAETGFLGTHTWDLQTVYARLDFEIGAIAPWVTYETGTQKSTGDALTEYSVGFTYALGGGASLDVYYYYQTDAGVVTNDAYEVDFSLSW